MTFEAVVIEAIGVGAATVAHVLAKFLHVHTTTGNTGFDVNLNDGIEDHEFKKFERLKLLANEIADGLRTVEHHLVIAEIEFEFAARSHDVVQLGPRPTGDNVGVTVLKSPNIEIIECFGQSFFGCFHMSPLTEPTVAAQTDRGACVQAGPIFARMHP